MIANVVGNASNKKMLANRFQGLFCAPHRRVFGDEQSHFPIDAFDSDWKRFSLSESVRLSLRPSHFFAELTELLIFRVISYILEFYLNRSMNLRSHLDRFCGLRPMDPDRHPRQRSRSPQRVHTPPGFRLSPFFAPPGWQPPPPRPDRAVIL